MAVSGGTNGRVNLTAFVKNPHLVYHYGYRLRSQREKKKIRIVALLVGLIFAYYILHSLKCAINPASCLSSKTLQEWQAQQDVIENGQVGNPFANDKNALAIEEKARLEADRSLLHKDADQARIASNPILATSDVTQIKIADAEKVKKRAKAAIVGAFVADAATMGVHWIYDVGVIGDAVDIRHTKHKHMIRSDSLSGKDLEPEFMDPPLDNGAYHYESGHLSPYGDEIMPLLEYMAKAEKCDFVGEDFEKEDYLAMKGYDGRLNSVIRTFLTNYEGGIRFPNTGISDNQSHGMVKVPILAARYAGTGDLEYKVREAVKVHQTNAVAAAAAVYVAQVLERVILGAPSRDTWLWLKYGGQIEQREILSNWPKAMSADVEYPATVFGQSCHNPEAFYVVANTVTYHSAGGYKDGVRYTALEGGDSCSRAINIGAILAAESDGTGIPKDWMRKMDPVQLEKVVKLADIIVEARNYVSST